MNKILTRIRKISSSQVSQALEDAVQSLGGPKTTQFLHSIERVDFDENNWTGHGLPDLLNVWDFTYQIDIPRMVYEE